MSKCIYTQEQFDKILEERNELANENFKLKQQLAEKEKEIETLKQILVDREETIVFTDKTIKGLNLNQNQDKISFAVEQLEKVKDMLPEENIPIYPYEILRKLIDQIEELKRR